MNFFFLLGGFENIFLGRCLWWGGLRARGWGCAVWDCWWMVKLATINFFFLAGPSQGGREIVADALFSFFFLG